MTWSIKYIKTKLTCIEVQKDKREMAENLLSGYGSVDMCSMQCYATMGWGSCSEKASSISIYKYGVWYV